MIRTLAVVGLGFVVFSSGCTCWMEFHTTGKGGSGGMGGDGGTAGSGGTGGITSTGGTSMFCTPGEVVECYSGPPGTKGKGECHEGTQTCADDGQSYGPCMDEQIPQPEECGSPKDEDCDGLAPPCEGACLWSLTFGDEQGQLGIDIATSQDGVAFIGGFSGTLDFGGGPKTSAGAVDIFVVKLAGDGSHLWSKAFGDGNNQIPSSVATDAAGNVVVVGRFFGTVDFGDGLKTSAGGTDIFVAKLAANDGAPLWSKRFGDVDDQAASGVAIDSAGNVIVTGAFAGTVDFGDGLKTSAGGTDIFVAKLAANDGAPLWSKRFGDASSQGASYTPIVAAVDSGGNILLAGPLAGTVDFGDGPKTSAGGVDIFVAKLAANDGAPLWSKRFGDSQSQTASGLAVDDAGDVVIAGTFTGTVDFGDGPKTSAGGADIFVAKLDANDGAPLWSKAFGDSGNQVANGLAVDGAGNAIVSGACSGVVNFGGGPLPCLGDADIFIAKFTPSGAHVWAQRFGDVKDQIAYGIAVDSGNNPLVTGQFSTAVDFGCGPLRGAGSTDVFIAKFSP